MGWAGTFRRARRRCLDGCRWQNELGTVAANEISFDQVMTSWLIILGLFVALCSCGKEGFAQVSRLEPEQPRWGQTLTILYDRGAPGAKFTSEEDVYVCAKLMFPDHTENFTAQMVKAGKQYRFELKVKEGL